MPARVLNGIVIRDQIYAELAGEISELASAGIRPGLAAVLVGDNPASKVYVKNKIAACEKLGLASIQITPPATITTSELLAIIEDLNRRDDVDGILVQLPLPPQVDAKKILEAVDPAKDVDGFHPLNVGHLVAGRPTLVPCTPAGVMELLRRSSIPLEGANAVVVGRSDIVGKPMALLLMHANATVTVCHSKTRDLPGNRSPCRPHRRRHGTPRNDYPRLRPPRRHRDRCGHQSNHRWLASRKILRQFSRAARRVPRQGHCAGWRRPSRRRQRRRCAYAGTRWSRSAHHRHAHEQYCKSRPLASRPTHTSRRSRSALIAPCSESALQAGSQPAKLRWLPCFVNAMFQCSTPTRSATRCWNRVRPPTKKSLPAFGKDILDGYGNVNRAKLGALIFADAEKRARLNQILHPRILQVVQKWFAALDEPDGPEFAVVEAALLVEANYTSNLDKLIVCWCRPEQQMERLLQRGLSAAGSASAHRCSNAAR